MTDKTQYTPQNFDLLLPIRKGHSTCIDYLLSVDVKVKGK